MVLGTIAINGLMRTLIEFPYIKMFRLLEKECMKKYFPNSADRSKANREFANFSSKSGEFGESDDIHDRYDQMEPKSWWVTYGANAPLLQNLGLKLLVQPSSSSCSKRNWSTFSLSCTQ